MHQPKTIFEILSLRHQWCELVMDYKIIKKHKQGDINSLEKFIDRGHKNNRFRAKFDEATTIAKVILNNTW
jgi:hypothetical protein